MPLTYSDHSSGYKELMDNSYDTMLSNIINDPLDDFEFAIHHETFKQDFFDYLEKFDKNNHEIISFCKSFFHSPELEPLRNRKYILKGKVVVNATNLRLGRLVKKEALLGVLQETLNNISLRTTGTISTAILDDSFLAFFLKDYSSFKHDPYDPSFLEYIIDQGIGEETISNFPMWSFENSFDSAPFDEYNLQDLPCILGLPDNRGKLDDYNVDCANSKLCVFELSVVDDVIIKYPNAFDAGVNNVWQYGGKTRVHDECKTKYGNNGFNEFIHEPVKFKNIHSELYSI